MEKGKLPQSGLAGTMIVLPTPCGHSVNYPARLAQTAMTRGVCSAFHTVCRCGVAYLVTTEPDSAHIRRGGETFAIVEAYENLPWKEHQLDDENGVFFYKEAPSLQAVLALLGS